MRFDVLSSDRVNNVLYGDGQLDSIVVSDEDIIFSENYNKFIYYDISMVRVITCLMKAHGFLILPVHINC